jgi:proline iminopeptidase
MSAIETQDLETPTSHIVYRVRAGKGPPVVFISGGPGMPDYLRAVANMLEVRTTVTYDQRGTGASHALNDDYSVAAHVADLEALRIELRAEKLHLCGHSWGGLLAQVYATEYPDRVASMLLFSPSTDVGAGWKSLERDVMRFCREHMTPASFAAVGALSILGHVPGLGRWALGQMYRRVWRAYQQSGKVIDADPAVLAGVGREATYRTRASIMALPDDTLDRVLPSGRIPICFVYGEHDIYGAHVERVRARNPRARFEIWKGAGHLAWLDDEPRFRATLRELFDERAKIAAS